MKDLKAQISGAIRSAVRIPAGLGGFPLFQNIQIGYGANPASNSLDTGIFPRAVKRSGRNVDISPKSTAEVKKKWGCKATPLYKPSRNEQGKLIFTVIADNTTVFHTSGGCQRLENMVCLFLARQPPLGQGLLNHEVF
jgi:hypothetical protein